ncbi:MAG: hypothetical protein KDI39_17405 [Pseudomonadales bacterium]|nr:hypothetical protein [Pseudomonadales bacterium]
MTTPTLDETSSPLAAPKKSVSFTQYCVQQLCALCTYGLSFLGLMMVSIAVYSLLHGKYFHLSANVNGHERVVFDIDPQHNKLLFRVNGKTTP